MPSPHHHLLRLSRRRLLKRGAATLLLLGAGIGTAARAEGIESMDVSFAPGEDGAYVLTADYAIALSSRLEEALNAIPLVFVFEFSLSRGRWYWFDQEVVSGHVFYRLTSNPLTRQYRLSISSNQADTAGGIRGLTFATLGEALRLIGRVRRPQVLPAGALKKSQRYLLTSRLRLDVSQLPKPFQLNALTQKEWAIDSEAKYLTIDGR